MNRLLTVGICTLLLGSFVAGRAVAQDAEEEQTKEWITPPAMKHALEDHGQCLTCHASGTEEAPASPANHEGRSGDTCLWCHAPDAVVQTTAPTAIPHDLERRSACVMCHQNEAMTEKAPQAPENHAGRPKETCTLCHMPGQTVPAEEDSTGQS
ncbi:MAG: hypothetical protein P8Y10_15185 [Gemmatimonadales bacterium]